MPWVRIDDGMPEHAKIERAGHLAAWLNICGLCYCNRNLTDGFVSDAVMPRLSTVPAPKKQAGRLVDEGLWERVKDGYLIHDYHTYQKSSEAIRKDRQAAAGRQARFRNGRSNSVTEPVSHDETRSVSHGSRDGTVTPSPRPVPSGSIDENSLPPLSPANVTEPKAPLLSKAERDVILAPARAVVRADGGVYDLDVKPETGTE